MFRSSPDLACWPWIKGISPVPFSPPSAATPPAEQMASRSELRMAAMAPSSDPSAPIPCQATRATACYGVLQRLLGTCKLARLLLSAQARTSSKRKIAAAPSKVGGPIFSRKAPPKFQSELQVQKSLAQRRSWSADHSQSPSPCGHVGSARAASSTGRHRLMASGSKGPLATTHQPVSIPDRRWERNAMPNLATGITMGKCHRPHYQSMLHAPQAVAPTS